MNEKFLKPYNPKETEARIYPIWEKSGLFNPDKLIELGITKPDSETFSIILPPPNATGVLHLGHTLEDSMQDTLIRYNRMQGKQTLWLPGTDHAAIATDTKVTKLLEKEGLRKKEIGREKFLEHVNKFVGESRQTIVNQLRKMGASLDWSREAFTLDEKRNLAVRTAFKKMYEEGLIYRGSRIVNWDTKGQTVISDDELVYEERKGKFYTFKYGPFEIGTARPETKFGDKYVVMHPDDVRYKDWQHLQKINLEWINGPIEATIIKDSIIDMEFGTGVMTITPWHSHEDFALAEKYNLDKEQIIDGHGRLLPIAGEFEGMKITEAREKIVDKLKDKGLLVSIDENYINRVATAERTGGTIEPQIMLQWFIDVNRKIPSRENKSLKELMLEPIKDGQIKVLPDHFEKVYYNWIENLHDWCISRQIWYGHRIPVWYKGDKVYCDLEAPTEDGWIQDEDTLDTWFSSGLWTFSTLGWPDENSPDLKKFHPTSVINPGYEILFFWVARMILMSQYLLGEMPFKTVYLHGMLRDAKGQKFSKSLDNGVDPLEIIDEYGADALRMSMIVGIGPGADSKFDVQKVKAYGKFSNKIWNIARFVFSQENAGELKQEIVDEFNTLAKDITLDMENYRFYLAAEKIYAYVWHRFADEIIEESKGKSEYGATLYFILENSLKILHPFMPFITEEVWSSFPDIDRQGKFLMVEKWPVKN